MSVSYINDHMLFPAIGPWTVALELLFAHSRVGEGWQVSTSHRL